MRRAVLIALVAGCGVRASDGGSDRHQQATDAAGNTDATRPLDAAPAPDAAPCVEGDAHVQLADGRCFAAFTAVAAIRTDAIAACAGYGMHLAYVKDQATEDAIAALVGTHVVAIGLDDKAVEGQFVWGDGTPLGPFSAWATGEPNNGNGQYEEDCAVFAGTKVPPGWDDKPCAPPPAGTGAYGYVCER